MTLAQIQQIFPGGEADTTLRRTGHPWPVLITFTLEHDHLKKRSAMRDSEHGSSPFGARFPRCNSSAASGARGSFHAVIGVGGPHGGDTGSRTARDRVNSS